MNLLEDWRAWQADRDRITIGRDARSLDASDDRAIELLNSAVGQLLAIHAALDVLDMEWKPRSLNTIPCRNALDSIALNLYRDPPTVRANNAPPARAGKPSNRADRAKPQVV